MAICLTACAGPSDRFFTAAARLGFTREVIAGAPFRHVLFRNTASASRTVHIYLDGDGAPWSDGRPETDPTPRNALVLRLMQLDSRPSVYVGRPCYHQAEMEPGCSPVLWTDGRYSEPVVKSMTRAVESVVERSRFERIVWIGYSGGGVLAALLAPRFPSTAAIVTVGANLDIDVWADWHGYRRLGASLNPARQARLPSRIVQRHYVGASDRVVPPAMVAASAPSVVVVPGFDHTCCWTRLWPSILADLDGVVGGD